MKARTLRTVSPVVVAALVTLAACAKREEPPEAPPAAAPVEEIVVPETAPADSTDPTMTPAPESGDATTPSATPIETPATTPPAATTPAATAPTTTPQASAPATTPAPAAATASAGNAQGAQIYKMSCSTCHGAEGKGDGVAAAALNPKPANFATGEFKYDTNGNGKPGEVEDIGTIVRDGTAKHGGSPLMAPWPTLSEAQRQAVAEYVKSLHVN